MIVPSTGRTSDWRAAAAASRMPVASTNVSIVVRLRTWWANPRSIWERITPELPRAPIRLPSAARAATSEIGASCSFADSSVAARRVRYMFVPVSPSGTGKTLRSLRTCRYFLKKYVPAARNFAYPRPSKAITSTAGPLLGHPKDSLPAGGGRGIIRGLSPPRWDCDVSLTNLREGTPMAKRCEVCGKGPRAGNNVSHAMNKTRRRWLPNLQKVKVDDHGTHRTAKVCTQCLRSKRITRKA